VGPIDHWGDHADGNSLEVVVRGDGAAEDAATQALRAR
jgi:hypothetical protein